MDLIERQAAIDALYHVDEYNGRSIDAIKNLPSAQPEKKKGKWYIDAEGDVRCTACKTKCLRDDIGINILSNYCPSCGVKMKEDQ